MRPGDLSRRDFLKLSGTALAGLFLPARWLGAQAADPLNEQGRVTDNTINIYDIPSAAGKVVGSYWRDIVLTITDLALDEDENRSNRVWYKIGSEGYAHSSSIQPVRTLLQRPAAAIPLSGLPAEVTVPYTDAFTLPAQTARVAYRLYYQTTYWLTDVVTDRDGLVWYRIYDDKDTSSVYALAEHIRIIPAEELSPLSADVPPEEKLIEVRLSQQLLLAYEGSRAVFAARTATGGLISQGRYATPQGWFRTYHKRPSRHMASGNLANRGFDLPGVPWVSYITESGISFHGTYWHNDFGRPRSHGCINLTSQAARWIYRWTTPDVPADRSVVYRPGSGTRVSIVE